MKRTEEMEREERAIAQLLQRATAPRPPEGAEDRLLARIRQTGQAAANNVVPLRKAQSSPLRRFLTVGLPLAASLVLGIIIGSDGLLDAYLPDSVAALVSGNGLELDLPVTLDDLDVAEGGLA